MRDTTESLRRSHPLPPTTPLSLRLPLRRHSVGARVGVWVRVGGAEPFGLKGYVMSCGGGQVTPCSVGSPLVCV